MDLYSEPFSATGGTAAQGVREALGRPELDTLAVLVREAVQNSWDARIANDVAIEFVLSARTIRGDARVPWRTMFGVDLVEGLSIDRVLNADSFDVLYVADRGTTGLAGPTRSDVSSGDGSSDFVDFFRNVGRPSDTHLGGGTYGYGKSVFYLVSRASTIAVHTRVRTEQGLQSRLMASALGIGFERDGKPFTGRHWWGTEESGIIEPVVGAYADELAETLGFPPFEASETGTTIAVLGFFGLDAEGEYQLLGRSCGVLAESIAWYCWPKFDIPGEPDQVQFTVTRDGDEVKVPGPLEIPSLALFRRSMAVVIDHERHETDHFEEVKAMRPRKLLGKIALTTGLVDGSSYEPILRPYEEPAHHVALMRNPRLIVKYQPGSPLPNAHTQWAGVFIADDGVDSAFADAEPPTHDDWVKDRLPKERRRYVSIAYTRIREITDRFFGLGQFASTAVEAMALGVLSSRLGTLMATATGIGARSQLSESGSRKRAAVQTPRGSVTIVEGPDLVEIDGVRAQRVGILARPVSLSTLIVDPRVVVDTQKTEGKPPVGAPQPELLSLSIEGEEVGEGFEVDNDVLGEILVSVPDDTMVRIDVRLDPVNAS